MSTSLVILLLIAPVLVIGNSFPGFGVFTSWLHRKFQGPCDTSPELQPRVTGPVCGEANWLLKVTGTLSQSIRKFVWHSITEEVPLMSLTVSGQDTAQPAAQAFRSPCLTPGPVAWAIGGHLHSDVTCTAPVRSPSVPAHSGSLLDQCQSISIMTEGALLLT